ncbi:hypothetical protein [Aquiflexum lacus]|uniref:hypothetical protein n=1 Tax=Aquiflexum lacus TaxID=2483805 RepID=UPI001894E8E6|nr:hypothetical protein [Aquiflexum lacus]
MMKRSSFLKILIFFCASGLFSCASTYNFEKLSRLVESNCYGGSSYELYKKADPLPLERLNLSDRLNNNFSKRNLNIANALGMLSFIDEYIKVLEEYEADPTLEKRIAYIERYQRLSQRFEASKMEISSVQSELNCEEDRLRQVSQYLMGIEGKEIKNLTVGSILLAATWSIVSVFVLNDSDAAAYFGLGVGIIGAGLGYSMLKVKKPVYFTHKRNHLKEVVLGPEQSELFPSSVWYYLNFIDTDGEAPKSMRGEILQKWRTLGVFVDIRSKDMPALQEKFFGEGGVYSSRELELRASMYDQVSAKINLMMQDLNYLIIEFGKMQNKYRE